MMATTKTLDKLCAELATQLRRATRESKRGTRIDVSFRQHADTFGVYDFKVSAKRAAVELWSKTWLEGEVRMQVLGIMRNILSVERQRIAEHAQRMDDVEKWCGFTEGNQDDDK